MTALREQTVRVRGARQYRNCRLICLLRLTHPATATTHVAGCGWHVLNQR